MQITDEWMAEIQDEVGLTNGQKQLLAIWKERQGFAGYGYLPNIVAHVIETCKGYRGIPEHVKALALVPLHS